MNKHVIFLDIDGTLVHQHGEVSLRVKQALQKVRQNGHYVFLCTGRNQIGIQQLLPIGFDGVICSAGGYIEINGKTVFESHIDVKVVQMIRDIFDRNHVLYNLECNDKVFQSLEMSHLLFSFEGKSHSEIERLIEQQRKESFIYSIEEYNDEDIQTICFIAKDMKDIIEPQNIISQKCQFLIYQRLSNDTINGEIMKKGIHKGFGIELVMKELGLPIENSIGFGDSMNDLQMIQTCYRGVVMANGDPKLKEYATTICESVEDDGIFHELYRLGLLR